MLAKAEYDHEKYDGELSRAAKDESQHTGKKKGRAYFENPRLRKFIHQREHEHNEQAGYLSKKFHDAALKTRYAHYFGQLIVLNALVEAVGYAGESECRQKTGRP
jgi:hypothetical protein